MQPLGWTTEFYYRVIYFFYTGRRIIFLHGFQKKTQRTPRQALQVARRRHLTFLEREKNKGQPR